MHKDFNAWNIVKKQLENSAKTLHFKSSEIWWCSFGVNVQSEISGKGPAFRRPVLIFKKLSKYLFLGIPLTSKEKTGTWFHKILIHGDNSYLVFSQTRAFHASRLQRRIATLDASDFTRVKEKLKTLLEL